MPRPRYDLIDRAAMAFGWVMLGACSVGIALIEICVQVCE